MSTFEVPHAQAVLCVRKHLLNGSGDGQVAVGEEGLGLHAPQLSLQEMKDPRVGRDVLVADEGLRQHEGLVVPIDAVNGEVGHAKTIRLVRVVADARVLKALLRF